MKLFKTTYILMPLVMILGLLSSCQKFDYSVPTSKQQEVTFSSEEISLDNKKNAQISVLSCDYAAIVVNQKIYKTAVYEIDGLLYTTAIKLEPGDYTLTSFMLMSNNFTPNDSIDDKIAYATPMTGSDYASFVINPAGFSFNVGSLTKVNVPVNVVLFNPDDYQKFGFDYDILTQTTVRSHRFEGQFKPANKEVYYGSIYQQQTNGLQDVMPAIYRIDVYRNDQYITSYDNESAKGEMPLEVNYPDSDYSTDHFRFDLYLYVKSGDGFNYRFIHSWSFTDAQRLQTSADGMVHFIIGDPLSSDINYAFGPFVDVSPNCTLTIDYGMAPGNLGSYFNGIVAGVNGNYALQNGTYPSYCGTDTISVNLGYAYQMRPISSLIPELLPFYTRDEARWNALNWLFNHLENYSFHDWDILQGASWMILNDWDGNAHSGVSNANSIVLQMVSDARQHEDFIPSYGQTAAVVFVPKTASLGEQIPAVQVVFMFVTL